MSAAHIAQALVITASGIWTGQRSTRGRVVDVDGTDPPELVVIEVAGRTAIVGIPAFFVA